MTDQEKTVFFNLSVTLEKALDVLIENQRFLIAVHEALVDSSREYAAAFAKRRDSAPPSGRRNQTEQMNLAWEAMAKKHLLALRNL